MTQNNKSCLITTGLINAITWFRTAPPVVIKPEKGGDGKTTWKEKAEMELLALLGREKRDFPEAAQQGVNFEKQIYKYANTPEKIPTESSEYFIKVCKEVQGYAFYKKGGKKIEVDGHKCYVYGKYDAIKLPKIKDIKTTKEYKLNKYLETVQHILYCYISGATSFEYVIAEWDEYPKIKNVYKESYEVMDQEELEKEVFSLVKDTIDFLKDYQWFDLYKEKFCLY